MKRILSLAFALVLLGIGAAQAGVINGSSTGLASPVRTLTFDEIVLAANTVLTNQYASLGVTFSPNVYYTPDTNNGSGYGHVQGNDFGNFTYPTEPSFIDPVTIMFSTAVTGAALSLDADGTPYLIEALLRGATVDSFTATIGVSNSDYYGFFNESFDAIRITQAGAGGGSDWVADNLQTGTSAVPEPSSIVLLSSGMLIGIGWWKRRRHSVSSRN